MEILLIEVTVLALAAVAFVRVMHRMTKTAERIERTADRIEEATAAGRERADRSDVLVGQQLERMERAAAVVAANLAAAVERADATEGAEGSAADAALRSGEE